jgi:hypothetical protein
MFDADSDFVSCDPDLDTERTPMLQAAADRDDDAEVVAAAAMDDDCRASLCDEQTKLIGNCPLMQSSPARNVDNLVDIDDMPSSVRLRTAAACRGRATQRRHLIDDSCADQLLAPSSSSMSPQTITSAGKRSDDSAFYDDDMCVECTCARPPPCAYMSHCHCACPDMGGSGDFRHCSGGRMMAASDIEDDDDDDDNDSLCSCCCDCNNGAIGDDQRCAGLQSDLDPSVAVTNLSSLAPISLLAARGQQQFCGQGDVCLNGYEGLCRQYMMSSVVALQSSSTSVSTPSSSSVISMCRSKSFNSHTLSSASSAANGQTSSSRFGFGLTGGRFNFRRRFSSSPSLPASSIPPCTCGLGVNGGILAGHLGANVGQQVHGLAPKMFALVKVKL